MCDDPQANRDEHITRGSVALLRDGDRFLIIQRAACVRLGGKWCLPGGGIEPGETSADAIVREMEEELSLCVRAIEHIWQWSRPDGGGTLVLDWWLVESDGGPITPNPAEVADIRWCTADEIRKNPEVLPGLVEFLDWYAPADHSRKA